MDDYNSREHLGSSQAHQQRVLHDTDIIYNAKTSRILSV